ncbi:ribonuclease P protein component [Sphingomonas sp. Leaf22]|nr:ribonuclease P protein component [Sphingomonas sp. Leaf22]
MSDEADFSAEQPGTGPSSRLPLAHGDAGRPQRDPRPPLARPEEAVGLTKMLRRRDYLAANAGRRAPMPGFVLLVRQRRADELAESPNAMRIGITVSKKVGNAVVRNRMKRRFRALAAEMLPDMGVAGADHVLIGRASGIERPFDDLKADLTKALRKVRR